MNNHNSTESESGIHNDAGKTGSENSAAERPTVVPGGEDAPPVVPGRSPVGPEKAEFFFEEAEAWGSELAVLAEQKRRRAGGR